MWDRGDLSGQDQDPAATAARDVSRLLAGAPGLRQIVELADRQAPHEDLYCTGDVGDGDDDSSRLEQGVEAGGMTITRLALGA